MSLSGTAAGADAATQSRIIVKWKGAAVGSRTKALNGASDTLRSAMGVGLNQRHSISDRMDVVELDTPLQKTEFNKALSKLSARSDVEFAVADERRFAHAVPDDPYFLASSGHPNGQWYLNNIEAGAVKAVDAWNLSTGGSDGSGVIVAVVDTGVRFDHPDLSSKLLSGYDFVSCDQSSCSGTGVSYLTANDGDGWDSDASDPGDWVTQALKNQYPNIFGSSCDVTDSSWHGTRVSGIIGAATNNGMGIAGIGYNVRILPVRALGRCGGYDSDIIAGMRWAAGLSVSGVPANPHPAKVINLSLGSSGSCTSAYVSAISEIRSAGVSIVASAGNESGTTDTPANCSGVIAVAGIRNDGTKVGYSSLISGSASGLAAPAGNCVNQSGECLYAIDTTTNSGTTTPVAYGSTDSSSYYTDSTNANLGTSFSSPIVSGSIGLMLAVNSSLTPATILDRLQKTTTAFPTVSSTPTCVLPTDTNASTTNSNTCNCTTSTCGAGILNANKAVMSVKPPVITINATSTGSQTIVLDGSASTAADGNSLTYAWSITGGSATLSSTSGTSTTVSVVDTSQAVTVKVTATDDWNNSTTQSCSITDVSGTLSSSCTTVSSSSSSSSSSSAGSSTSASSSSSVASSSTAASSGGGGGGGSMGWLWLIALSAPLGLRGYSRRFR